MKDFGNCGAYGWKDNICLHRCGNGQLRRQSRPTGATTTSSDCWHGTQVFVGLPKEARDALRPIEALGSPEDLEEIKREIARTLLHVQYKVARRQMMEHAKVENLNQLETEDDILCAAVNLTR